MSFMSTSPQLLNNSTSKRRSEDRIKGLSEKLKTIQNSIEKDKNDRRRTTETKICSLNGQLANYETNQKTKLKQLQAELNKIQKNLELEVIERKNHKDIVESKLSNIKNDVLQRLDSEQIHRNKQILEQRNYINEKVNKTVQQENFKFEEHLKEAIRIDKNMNDAMEEMRGKVEEMESSIILKYKGFNEGLDMLQYEFNNQLVVEISEREKSQIELVSMVDAAEKELETKLEDEKKQREDVSNLMLQLLEDSLSNLQNGMM
eukprot:TRINITY_DN98_c0_g1_i1.p1 TRINITY_DN98_c0_g1~~TRINITY_DN98_c0_g1_i1.p1  ORF type:complete len:273 (-),score=105.10 TRINITY_DN98_c0_g1_i1:31-813(-)